MKVWEKSLLDFGSYNLTKQDFSSIPMKLMYDIMLLQVNNMMLYLLLETNFSTL